MIEEETEIASFDYRFVLMLFFGKDFKDVGKRKYRREKTHSEFTGDRGERVKMLADYRK